MTTRNRKDSTRELVRQELSAWDPYFWPDEIIDLAWQEAERDWIERRERIAVELKLSEKQRAEREPIPDQFIAWDAAHLISNEFTYEVFLWRREDGFDRAM